MRNTVLVNICENPNFNPFGFWYMDEEKARTTKFLAAHDNKRVLGVYEIHERFQVDMVKSYDKIGDLRPKDRERDRKWVFRLTKLNITQSGDALKQLANVDLKGVQGVIYANVEL